MIKVQNKDIIWGSIIIALVLISYLWEDVASLLSILICLFSVVKLFETKNNVLVIIQILMLTYAVIPVMYFILGIRICHYQAYDLNEFRNMLDVLRIQSIFLLFFLCGLDIHSNIHIVDNVNVKKNDFAYYATFSMMLICYLMIDWRSIISEVNKTYSIDAAGSSFFYYFSIAALVNYQFSDSKKRKFINFCLSVVLAMLSLLTGKRMATVMIGFLVYILFFSKIIGKKLTVVASFTLFLFLRLFEQIRFRKSVGLKEMINNMFTMSGTISNNQGDVWYASEAINELICTKVFDLEFTIKNIIGTIINSFMPASFTPQEGILNQYISRNRLFPYPNDGGFISMYGYLWGRFLGVIIVAIFLSKLINNTNAKNSITSMWSILVIVTFPRWYAYNPRILMKFLVIYLIIYFVSHIKI